MQVKTTHTSDTEAVVTVAAKPDELHAIKEHVLGHFQSRVKLSGFREGKAPLNLVEKNVDQTALQTEFLEEAINQLYPQAIQSAGVRPVDRPEITLQKFVPFNTLEFEAKVAVIGEIKLPDYRKMKVERLKVTVTTKDVDDVIEALRQRAAAKKDVDRPAKKGDQVWIDFKGTDAKGQPVKGAEGKDYPLQLGSNTFIPGFEDNLNGLKAGEDKTFTLTFPKDYGVKALANQKVTFAVTVTKVQEPDLPKLDDEFAATVGPVKTVAELKADVKKQLLAEKEHKANLDYESEIVRLITDKSKVTIPEVLIEDQIDRLEEEERRNLTYRGQTWQEHLDEEGVTPEQHRKQKRAAAEDRVKASLVLAEIAELEKLEVTPEELEIRMQVLRAQYQDAEMQRELDKPETRRDIAARMLTEKTLAKLASYLQE